LAFDRILEAQRLIVEVDDESPRPKELNWVDFTALMKDAADRVNHGYCVICRIAGTSGLPDELHHIAGKINGEPNLPDTIPVCVKLCHRQLSELHDAWYSRSTDLNTRLSCYFYGWSDVFLILHIRSGLPYFEKLAGKFRAKGRDLRIRRGHPAIEVVY
jgi:hypothetical protein